MLAGCAKAAVEVAAAPSVPLYRRVHEVGRDDPRPARRLYALSRKISRSQSDPSRCTTPDAEEPRDVKLGV